MGIKREEVCRTHAKDLHRCAGPDSRVSPGLAEQAHLAKVIARAQGFDPFLCAVLPLHQDRDRAGLNNVNLPSYLALADNLLSGAILLQHQGALGKKGDDHEENDGDEDQTLRGCKRQQKEGTPDSHGYQSKERHDPDRHLGHPDQPGAPVTTHNFPSLNSHSIVLLEAWASRSTRWATLWQSRQRVLSSTREVETLPGPSRCSSLAIKRFAPWWHFRQNMLE